MKSEIVTQNNRNADTKAAYALAVIHASVPHQSTKVFAEVRTIRVNAHEFEKEVRDIQRLQTRKVFERHMLGTSFMLKHKSW